MMRKEFNLETIVLFIISVVAIVALLNIVDGSIVGLPIEDDGMPLDESPYEPPKKIIEEFIPDQKKSDDSIITPQKQMYDVDKYPTDVKEQKIIIPAQTSPQKTEQKIKICGPDVTDGLAESLTRIQNRILASRLNSKDDSYKIEWMFENGNRMDYWVRSTKKCPSNCAGTVTLAGYCVYEKAANNIMYGFIGHRIGIPFAILLGGGHFAEVMKRYGLDPREAQAAYAVGYELSRGTLSNNPVTYEDIRNALKETTYDDKLAIGSLSWNVFSDCQVCPESQRAFKDFATEDWVWPEE